MNARLVSWFRLLAVVGLVLGLALGAVPGTAADDDGGGDDDRRGAVETDDDRDEGGGDEDDDDDAPRGGGRAPEAVPPVQVAPPVEPAAPPVQPPADNGAPAVAPPPAGVGVEPAAAPLASDDDDGLECEIIDDDGDPSTDGYCAGRVIVRLVAGTDVAAFNKAHATKLIGRVRSRNLYLLRLPAGADEAAAVEEIAVDPATVWAEPDFVGQAPEGRPRRLYLRGDSVSGGPSDSWAPHLLGVAEANACATGQGVTVAVIDTGIDAGHPAFANRLAAGRNFLRGEEPRDVRDVGNGNDDDGDGHVDEMVGHGTHVAGIVLQVAPQAHILPIRALDSDGAGDAFFLAAAIYHALDRGAQVINLSLGSTHDPRAVREAVAEATAAGIVVTAAAGNEDREVPPEYPAVGGDALGVAATDAADRKSEFSNFHPTLFLSAPGTDIVSAYPGGGYGTWSGTSMATPWVAGAAALLLGASPDRTAADVAQRLGQSAVNLDGPNPGYQGLLGAGRLDVAAASAC